MSLSTLKNSQGIAIIPQQPTPKRQVDLGSIDVIPLGEGRAFQLDDLGVAVFRQRDGNLFATQSHCPHRQGPLADGIVGGGTVICPFHAWKFDLATGRCAAENVTLRTFPVYEIDGRILIEVESSESVMPAKAGIQEL
jgi:nitrite reductase (NADH) small subunit